MTPEEYEDALVKFAKSPPDMVDEAEFRRRLRDTSVYRYEVGTELLRDVGDLLRRIGNDNTKAEIDLAVEKLDAAAVQIAFGALAFNKGATAGIRNILQVRRDDMFVRPEFEDK